MTILFTIYKLVSVFLFCTQFNKDMLLPMMSLRAGKTNFTKYKEFKALDMIHQFYYLLG